MHGQQNNKIFKICRLVLSVVSVTVGPRTFLSCFKILSDGAFQTLSCGDLRTCALILSDLCPLVLFKILFGTQ